MRKFQFLTKECFQLSGVNKCIGDNKKAQKWVHAGNCFTKGNEDINWDTVCGFDIKNNKVIFKSE